MNIVKPHSKKNDEILHFFPIGDCAARPSSFFRIIAVKKAESDIPIIKMQKKRAKSPMQKHRVCAIIITKQGRNTVRTKSLKEKAVQRNNKNMLKRNRE